MTHYALLKEFGFFWLLLLLQNLNTVHCFDDKIEMHQVVYTLLELM